MTYRVAYSLFVLAAACGRGVHHSPGADAPIEADDAGSETTREAYPLAMNDISIMMPTMFSGIYGKLDGVVASRDLVPRGLYARIGPQHHDITADYDDFLVFGIRFDLCDRTNPGPCPSDADGSLRIVFQPLGPVVVSVDAAIHAFYTIPNAELGYMVNELRAIARLGDAQGAMNDPLEDAHLRLFAGIPRLKALVDKYAVPEQLIRLAAMGQDTRSTTPLVVFRQLDLVGTDFVDTMIPTINATEQTVAVADTDPSYTITPVVDQPAGFAVAISATAFNDASFADQGAALDALEAAVNPRRNTPQTVQCATCHVQTYITRHRANLSGVDVTGLPNHFASSRNVHVNGTVDSTNEHTLHNFSWIESSVSISQRVANETAVVLDEIDQRFPPAQ